MAPGAQAPKKDEVAPAGGAGAKPSVLSGSAKPFSPMGLASGPGRPSALTASAAPFVPRASTPGNLDPSAKAFVPGAARTPGSASATPSSQMIPRANTMPTPTGADAADAFPTSPSAPPAGEPAAAAPLRKAAAPWAPKSPRGLPKPEEAAAPADEAAAAAAPASSAPAAAPGKALWRPRGGAPAAEGDENEKPADAPAAPAAPAAPSPTLSTPAATPSTLAKKVTSLAESWTLWYRPAAAPNANGDWQSNLKSIITFDDVQTFWRVYNSIKAPSALTKGATYYLFRKGVEPAWEDKTCEQGGEWKVWLPAGKRADTDTLWVMFTLQCIGEQFLNSADICGIAVETRSKADRVCVWTSTTEKTRTMALGREVKKTLKGYIPQDQPLCFTSVKRSLNGGDKEVDYCIAD
eukprot:TRINITY_DN1485_c0_g2_i1.p1 TRINITY_DN1485_c0_g2~~TRINITY_DN1485_c0_g2_i1.p1  ORF type:complete len:475 (+),score=140.02 TRINITY_DN1485_c0_g2_i1:202-1425(+)